LRRRSKEDGQRTPYCLAAPLPCLYSNNGIENATRGEQGKTGQEKVEAISALTSLLSPYHKKAAQTLFLNVQRLITKEASSVNHVGFLTLTFPDNVTDHKEAHERFRSFRTNYLSKHPSFGSWVHVKERQKRGAWHYHIIVVLKGDIRSGVNWDELSRGVYRSANPYLKSLWQDLRENLQKYGFGRSELLPIRSNEEAMARYIGKYISKHMGSRTDSDKGVRLVNYSRDWVRNSVRFAWNTDNAHEWRRKLSLFAGYIGCSEFYQISEKLGSGWAYKYIDYIMDIDSILFQEKYDSPSLVRKQYVPSIICHLEKRLEQRKNDLQASLTLHSGPDKKDLKKKENQDRVKAVSVALPGWLDEFRLYAVKYSILLDKDESDLKAAYSEKIALNRILDARSVMEKEVISSGFHDKDVYVRDGDRCGEKIPF
jgi:hypothetical protein